MFTTSLTNQLPDDSLLSSSLLNSLASQNLFIQRKSKKTSASGFVFSLLSSVIDGHSSFRDLSRNLSYYQHTTISRQAAHQRINKYAVDFMKNVNANMLAEKFSQEFPRQSNSLKRILIEDASTVKMHKGNSGNFRACGDKEGSTAAFKLDFCYDLLSGEAVSNNFIAAHYNDKKAGAMLIDQHVKKGDLVLRDMGYYSQPAFRLIENKGACWFSKIPTNVNITYKGKDFNETLKTTKLDSMDIEVELGKDATKVRLIACRATPEQATQKRRKANQQAKNHGKTPRKAASLRNGWHIAITNVSKEQMKTQEMIDLYRLRWQIENIFKAWKQSVHLEKCFNKKSNIYHQQCLIEASLMLLILTMKFVMKLQVKQSEWVSIFNIAISLMSYIRRLQKLDDLCLFDPDPREISMEKRKRPNLMKLAKKTLT